MHRFETRWRQFLLSALLALSAALCCVWLKTPLPWMIGPLVATAVARMRGAPLWAPVQAREAGQWAIGCALGLYFTPPVLLVLQAYAGWIAPSVLFALLLGAGCGRLLRRLSGVDGVTAFFAMAVGGASEMATQGERHGAVTEQVAAAHSLRIMMVVLIVPFGFKFLDVRGLDPYVQGSRIVDTAGLLALMAITCVAGWSLRRLRVPNAWVLGPLFATIALTSAAINLSALPQWTVNAGQLLIGLSLGTRFTPAFLHTAPRYLAAVALCSLSAIVLALGFACGLAWLSGMPAATAVLATSPGGIAEMSLTAKTLQLGVPIVTAFHVVRMVALVLLIGPLFRIGEALRRRA